MLHSQLTHIYNRNIKDPNVSTSLTLLCLYWLIINLICFEWYIPMVKILKKILEMPSKILYCYCKLTNHPCEHFSNTDVLITLIGLSLMIKWEFPGRFCSVVVNSASSGTGKAPKDDRIWCQAEKSELKWKPNKTGTEIITSQNALNIGFLPHLPQLATDFSSCLVQNWRHIFPSGAHLLIRHRSIPPDYSLISCYLYYLCAVALTLSPDHLLL